MFTERERVILKVGLDAAAACVSVIFLATQWLLYFMGEYSRSGPGSDAILIFFACDGLLFICACVWFIGRYFSNVPKLLFRHYLLLYVLSIISGIVFTLPVVLAAFRNR